MIKRCANLSLIYALMALAFGVFFREFTKANQFTGETTLSFIHPHYLALGTVFFLLLMVLDKTFAISSHKHMTALLVSYQIGLNITVLALFVRGLFQVLGTELSRGLDASISGVAGLGHTILGVSLVLLLLKIRKQAAALSPDSEQKHSKNRVL
ncbi:MAG TPA: DUF2871 domain-containing protein [Candidatus Limiplasma sp.]|nr:DUF2871 domain-containing protein [Candidatus Limiplasma sp.]HRX09173.1 DUF2871 domain-containing protein [Candidatus Limiplasma sp.]